MLLELKLTNFAIIDALSINFESGLNIITGETGTGKSIIIDAINIIMGDKFNTDYIRTGEKESTIEALFEIPKELEINSLMEDLGFESPGGELIIKRVVNLSGRNKTYINNSICKLSVLQKITDGLVNVFGQHEHQNLLRKNNHLSYLDNFSQVMHELLNYKESFKKLTQLKKEYEELSALDLDKSERQDFLKFQLKEIKTANLKPGEDEELEKERIILSNSENFSSSLRTSYRLLYDAEGSAFASLKQALNSISQITGLDKKIDEIDKRLDPILIEIEDISYEVREFLDKVKHDPQRLETVISRLNDIGRLKKKYGSSVDEVIKKQDDIEKELSNFENHEEILNKLQKQIESVENNTHGLALKLSEKRKSSSLKLKKMFRDEVESVGLKGAFLEIEFSTKDLSPDGKDNINFLFSANPDQSPKPLAKVASGGELSRIMLILKGFVSSNSKGSILIFDEADTGIGGAVAETIGIKIKSLSTLNQVICITHLPQVAKFADHHLVVNKVIEDNKTEVFIDDLDDNGRIHEIGRMLAGKNISKNTLQVAKELISGKH